MYIIFAGARYYPCEGAEDIIATFDDFQDAKTYIDEMVMSIGCCDWVHAYDTDTEFDPDEFLSGVVYKRESDW